jgi:hypothetical protein
VRALWNFIEARDWPGARALLADDLIVELPATGERFTSADAFVRRRGSAVLASGPHRAI